MSYWRKPIKKENIPPEVVVYLEQIFGSELDKTGYVLVSWLSVDEVH